MRSVAHSGGLAGRATSYYELTKPGIAGFVNAVLRSLDLKPGDEILVTDHTYGAVRNTVRYVCARSHASMVEVRLPFPAPSADAIVANAQAVPAATSHWKS